MTRVSYVRHRTPSLTILDEGAVTEIINSAFLILERTGAKVTHQAMGEKLKKAGATGGPVYRVSRALVQECLDRAPKGLVIYDRLGRPAMNLEGGRSYFGTSTASPEVRDALTGEIHETRLSDISQAAAVADRLENIDFVMPFGSAQDCPGSLADAHEFLALTKETIKPVVFCGYSAKGVALTLELAEVLAGGSEALRERPMAIPYPEPISPLTWPDDIVEKIIVCAGRGAPHLTTSAQIRGMSAPMTLAGGLVLSTAESLFSNVMAQLTRPGAPVFLAAIVGTVDPRNGLACMAGPEYCLAMSAQAEIGRRLGLPTWGTGGVTAG